MEQPNRKSAFEILKEVAERKAKERESIEDKLYTDLSVSLKVSSDMEFLDKATFEILRIMDIDPESGKREGFEQEAECALNFAFQLLQTRSKFIQRIKQVHEAELSQEQKSE